MPSPFPGMDPYVEPSGRWRDFHDSLIAALCGGLQKLLKPRFVAVAQDRFIVVETDRSIYPDVGVFEKNPGAGSKSAAALAERTSVGVEFELDDEVLREPYLTIVEAVEGRPVVTAIEVLSPTNKRRGAGMDSYLQKRQEYLEAGVNVVEIDLLKQGESVVYADEWRIDTVRPFDYLGCVTSPKRRKTILHPFHLRESLPALPIPLLEGVPDVALALQAPSIAPGTKVLIPNC